MGKVSDVDNFAQQIDMLADAFKERIVAECAATNNVERRLDEIVELVDKGHWLPSMEDFDLQLIELQAQISDLETSVRLRVKDLDIKQVEVPEAKEEVAEQAIDENPWANLDSLQAAARKHASTSWKSTGDTWADSSTEQSDNRNSAVTWSGGGRGQSNWDSSGNASASDNWGAAWGSSRSSQPGGSSASWHTSGGRGSVSKPHEQDWHSTAPNDDGWGSAPKDAGWGSAPKDAGWGSAPKDNGWGSTSKDEGWGNTSKDDGWGSDPKDDGWGSAPKDDGWGSAPKDDGWGSAPKDDGWGSTSKDDGWGSTSNNGWGSTSKDDRWGSAPKIDAWGGTSKDDGWGQENSEAGAQKHDTWHQASWQDDAQKTDTWQQDAWQPENGGKGSVKRYASREPEEEEENPFQNMMQPAKPGGSTAVAAEGRRSGQLEASQMEDPWSKNDPWLKQKSFWQ